MFGSDIDKNLKPAYDNVTVLVNLKKRTFEQGERSLQAAANVISSSTIVAETLLGVEMPNVLVTTLAICEIEDTKSDMDRILKGTSRQWSQWRQEDNNNNNNNNSNSNDISNENLNDKKIINNGIET
ncbi:saposin B domain-containing protein [Reticulomyxa filosa]|uniref:Saposin B domain-containing protein n=1 Tax=Reticulomyxa filosa TaxID=46433 RepID=X6LSN9_RETFI|nr:saposin B domain-containing protein [Reticulomyxa filosa]|eukprot:ETO04903.1 saposin B domain-containing protein [Reticulomyxa filosa]